METTVFSPLGYSSQQEALEKIGVRDAPFEPIIAPQQRQQPPLNRDIIPDDLINLDQNLEKIGSTTSTLSTVLAWLGAAKGDFRLLQSIEDEKRRTALAKAVIPHVRQYNKMVTEGKLDEASAYMDRISAAFAERAPSLAPYLQQMAAKLSARQEGLAKAETIYKALDSAVPKEHVIRPMVDSIGQMVKDKSLVSEGILTNMLTRMAPHIQQIGGGVTLTDPFSGRTVTTAVPQLATETTTRDFVGYTLANRHNLSAPNDVANIINNVPVKDASGNTITPNSEKAQQIKQENAALQPIKAQLDILQALKVEPTQVLQLIKTSPAFNQVSAILGGSGAIDTALNEHMKRLTEQTVAVNTGTVESDPTAITRMGKLAINVDPNNPNTFLTPVTQPITIGEVNRSGGNIAVVDPTLLRDKIEPALEKIQGLDLIPQMLTSGNTPQTGTERLGQALTDRISRFIGAPLGKNVEIRQQARVILDRAIEQVENMLGKNATSIDNENIAVAKQYATGSLRTDRELIAAAEAVRLRLAQVIKRNIGIDIPVAGSTSDVMNKKTTPTAVQQRQQSSQRRAPSILPLSPKEGAELNRIAIENEQRARKAVRSVPEGTSATREQTVEQPAVNQQPLSPKERVNQAVQRRRLQSAQ